MDNSRGLLDVRRIDAANLMRPQRTIYRNMERKRRIVMAVTNDLVTDQRVDRNCKTLLLAGYDVTLVGRRLPESPALQPRGYRTVRMRLMFRRSALFYAEYNVRLLVRLLTLRADAFYANDTDTLLACTWAARLRGKRLLFDAHELFPEVPELVDKPKVRSVWEWVERTCLPRVDAAMTVCQSVAEEYGRRYGVTMAVVRNMPETASVETKDFSMHEVPHTILYQGAVNVGRGVRELIDAMRWLADFRLVVAGNGDVLQDMQAYTQGLPWCERVVFMGRMAPEALHRLTTTAAVGVCLLEDLGLNYRYALPNRIADFAHAGVPIVATGFVEIRRVLERYGTGTCVAACPQLKEGPEYEAYVRQLAEAITDTWAQWCQLSATERHSRMAAASADMCWENEKKVLLSTVDAIF